MAIEGADWFDENAPATGAAAGASSFGHPTLDRIAEIWRRATGRTPTRAEVSQWGTNINDQYLRQIETTIYQTPEAVAYARQQQSGGTTAAGSGSAGATTPAPSAGGTGLPSEWTLESLKAYARSRGVEWTDAQAQYWLSKKAELDARGREIGDPNYANMRLSLADEWTPADQRYSAGAAGGLNTGDLLAPFTEQFQFEDFKAPTVEDLKGDPGFQAALDRASDTLQRSAAAKGSLLSGSTLQDLSDRTASMTQEGYQNLFGRALTSYGTRRQNAYDQYKERRANFYQNQDSPFAKLFGLAQLDSSNNNYMAGLQAQYANMGANAILGGANAANTYATGGANATAAGQVGSGNAYSSLFGGLSQIPWWLYAQRGGTGYRTHTYQAPYQGTPNLY